MAGIEERQKFIKYYKQRTGESEIDMRKVALMAKKLGWALPEPVNPIDLLARQFKNAARQEIRRDKETKLPYRAYHAYPMENLGMGEQGYWWIDIDDPNATTHNFRKSAVLRREQMVDDGVQLTLDLDHWNSIHPNEGDHVNLPMDLSLDIEIRRAAIEVIEKSAQEEEEEAPA
jgi:hypothetical protein